MHGTALMTAQRSSSSCRPLPLIHVVRISSQSFFDSKQLFGPVCHLVYFRGVMILLESKLLLCLDDLTVTLPYSLATITNPFQLGLWPEATLSDAARGPDFLPEILAGRVDGYHFSIWTSEAVPSCWLVTRVSSTFPWVTAWIWLIATLVGIIPTGLYHRVSVMIYGAPQGLCSQCVIGVGCHLDWTGRESDKLRLWLSRAMPSYWLDGWSTVPTADPAFLSARVGPLATLTFRCAAREQSNFVCLRPRASAKNGCSTAVPAARMSDAGETGGRVMYLYAGLLLNAKSVVPSSYEEVMEVSASLTEHVGPAPDVAVAESNHGRSLTKLAWLIWERTSLKVVSLCSVILVHWSSCFWTILNHWSS